MTRPTPPKPSPSPPDGEVVVYRRGPRPLRGIRMLGNSAPPPDHQTLIAHRGGRRKRAEPVVIAGVRLRPPLWPVARR
jgi:hypothetical protein